MISLSVIFELAINQLSIASRSSIVMMALLAWCVASEEEKITAKIERYFSRLHLFKFKIAFQFEEVKFLTTEVCMRKYLVIQSFVHSSVTAAFDRVRRFHHQVDGGGVLGVEELGEVERED